MSSTITTYRKEPFILQDKNDSDKKLKIDLSNLTDEITISFPDQSENIGVPTGMVMWYTLNTPPGGWLECDGSAVSRTTYSKLFGVIGTNYGSGNGSTTFNLPELRAQFIRGWDNGRGVDSGRSFGSTQGHAIQQHNHVTSLWLHFYGGGSSSGSFRHSNVGDGSSNVTSSNTGGAETRPRNTALLPCIKI
jgi:microcystin-dependent protein